MNPTLESVASCDPGAMTVSRSPAARDFAAELVVVNVKAPPVEIDTAPIVVPLFFTSYAAVLVGLTPTVPYDPAKFAGKFTARTAVNIRTVAPAPGLPTSEQTISYGDATIGTHTDPLHRQIESEDPPPTLAPLVSASVNT